MDPELLHEAAIDLAIEKRLIKSGERYTYLLESSRITEGSYVLVRSSGQKQHRLPINEVEGRIKLLALKKANRERDKENAEKWEEYRKKAKVTQEESYASKQTFHILLNNLTQGRQRWSFASLFLYSSGGITLANSILTQPESSIHQIYQIIGVVGGVGLIGLGALNAKAKVTTVYLEATIQLLNKTENPKS
ncbi:hypothetical protein [Synechococcus sp. CBW1107]|uniref:hypothetical protein n=1 Tax=Synechococcus sp. CBW1107 TaxID=2789857 RepID=UPI002AD3CF61|nr:hypothetical protein [Synechococcus sp. CBW1107]CAK6701001.1 hypothetical protein IFHNHDMJ_02979 [Synechococcus sp. CBW1107]